MGTELAEITTDRAMSDHAIRHRYTDDVIGYFRARPNVWLPVRELATVGGFAAWRTRISEARKAIEQDSDWTIVWNGKSRDSAYRYQRKPLGRSAETIVSGQQQLALR